jgi:hypothetical protein
MDQETKTEKKSTIKFIGGHSDIGTIGFIFAANVFRSSVRGCCTLQ